MFGQRVTAKEKRQLDSLMLLAISHRHLEKCIFETKKRCFSPFFRIEKSTERENSAMASLLIDKLMGSLVGGMDSEAAADHQISESSGRGCGCGGGGSEVALILGGCNLR